MRLANWLCTRAPAKCLRPFNEAQLEAAVVELLDEQGYPHARGTTLNRPGNDNVILRDDLHASLRKRYGRAGLTEAEANRIIHELEVLPASDLYASNRTIIRKVMDGFILKRDDHRAKDLYIHLLDFTDLDPHYESVPAGDETQTNEVFYAFYQQVIALRPEWAEAPLSPGEGLGVRESSGDAGAASHDTTVKPMARVKMIMTRDKDDPQELYDALGTKDYRKELDRQFKEAKSNFKIAIVVDMWLTGFDVPFLDSIYIDKPIQRHNLIQTISRVNRRYAGKEKGLVVDYIGIKRQLNLAMALYGKGEEKNLEEVDQSIVALRDQLDLLRQVFHRFDSTDYFHGTPLQQLEALRRAGEYVQVTQSVEKRFLEPVKRMKAAYDFCTGSEALTQEERDHVHFYLAVRSIIHKLTKGDAPDTAQMNARVREMIDQALASDGVEELFTFDGQDGTQDIFSDDYLKKLEKIKLPNTRIKLLQQLLKKAIDAFRRVNRAQGINFSDKLRSLVERYNDRTENDTLESDVIDDLAAQIVDMIREVRTEWMSYEDLSIDFEGKAFYDIRQQLCAKYDFKYPDDKLLVLAQEVKQVVDDKAKYTDWHDRADIQASLKMDLIILLANHGYPPIDRDEVYREIFEQAENY